MSRKSVPQKAPPPPKPDVAAGQAPQPTKGKGGNKAKGKGRGKSTPGTKSTCYRDEAYPSVNPHTGGIDIGNREIVACAPGGESGHPGKVGLQTFPTHTKGIISMAEWFVAHGVTSVAMEATGVLWLAPYEILEDHGLEVCLVNPRSVRIPQGKKTDVRDAQHIQHLHSMGLLSPSFRPEAGICELRQYNRTRVDMVRDRARAINQMVKVCNAMNLKVTTVISSVATDTGLRIVRAIVGGERDPLKLAALRDPRCRKSVAEIALALEGNFRKEHVYALECALQKYDFFTARLEENAERIRECTGRLARGPRSQLIREVMGDEAAEAYLAGTLDEAELPEDLRAPATQSAAEAREELIDMCNGVDVASIPGISLTLALMIISEAGTDMSKFRNSKAFCSWMCVNPGSKVSGGKILCSATRHSNALLNYAFRLAAQSAANSKGTPIADCINRLRVRLGGPRAITAGAHKLARIFYSMMKNGTNYDPKRLEGDAERVRARDMRKVKALADKLGLALVDKASVGQQTTAAA